MAMRSDRPRSSEHGLSIVEALVIVTMTALIAALLLPLTSRATGRTFALADRSLDAASMADGERAFRMLMHGVAQPAASSDAGAFDGGAFDGGAFDGGPRVMTFTTSLSEAAACARTGEANGIQLRIVESRTLGRLVCDADGAQREIVRWSAGSAAFSYSADGAAWAPSWRQRAGGDQAARGGAAPPTYLAPLVRFQLVMADGRRVAWIERAGWSAATNVDRRAAPTETTFP